MPKTHLITIDLGGTKILSALINEKNEIVYRYKIPTDLRKGKANLVKSIAESVKVILAKNELGQRDIKAVCMGVPGTVNPANGVISVAPNIGVKNYNIKEALQQHFKIPVLIENDVNLAGLGIKQFEFKNNINNMLVVAVGTGIGGALFFEGKLYRGSSFFAGEIGHMLVQKKGSLEGKLVGTTFESLASRTAIVREILKDLKKKKKSVLKDYVSPKKSIKSKTLLAALNKKDSLATKHVTAACTTIGTVLGSITTLINIDTIVLAGGVIEAMGDFMLPKIKKSFKDAVLKDVGKNVKILTTKLGDDAAILGGVALAEEFLN